MKSESIWQDTDLRIAACVFILLLGYMATIQCASWQPNCAIGTDAPYHITMADLFPQLALKRTFPHMAMSVWRNTFYDKSLAFHALLYSLRKWAGALGYTENQPPFIMEATVLVILVLTVFWALLWKCGVRLAYLFLPIFLLGFPFFTLRVNMVRPQIMAIVLMMTTVGLLTANPLSRKRLLEFGIVGFAFAYCHSNPHFMLLPTLVFAAVYFPVERWRALWPTWAAAGGIIGGLTIHPQFPNTFIIWKIQCIDALWEAVTHAVPDITTPGELGPPALVRILHNLLLLLIPVAVAAVALHRKRYRDLDRRFWFLFALSTICCVGFFISKRMIEFAAPFTTLVAGVAYQRWLGQRSRRFHLVVLAAVALFVVSLRRFHVENFTGSRVPIPTQFAAWARATLPPGTYIANLRWDDFPPLFFAAPEYVYSYGLDPMFAYRYDPKDFLQIERFSRDKEPFPPAAKLKKMLGTRYVFLSFINFKVARRMAEKHYALAYQGIDGWCFDLDAPPVNHHIKERLAPVNTY